MPNSCRKGKVGERDWRDFLRERGLTARRGQQFQGSPESPDVVCDELDAYHFEVKRTEALRLHEALAQAADDAGARVPIVAHRRSRGEWVCVLRAKDLVPMLIALAVVKQDVREVNEQAQGAEGVA